MTPGGTDGAESETGEKKTRSGEQTTAAPRVNITCIYAALVSHLCAEEIRSLHTLLGACIINFGLFLIYYNQPALFYQIKHLVARV